jgi:uncharacterized membrane protein YgcG
MELKVGLTFKKHQTSQTGNVILCSNRWNYNNSMEILKFILLLVQEHFTVSQIHQQFVLLEMIVSYMVIAGGGAGGGGTGGGGGAGGFREGKNTFYLILILQVTIKWHPAGVTSYSVKVIL